MRFSLMHCDAPQGVIQRLASQSFSEPTLLVLSGGAVGLADAPVLTNSAAYELKLPEQWKDFKLGLLAWLKSSFFVWYCAVHLGTSDLFSLFRDIDVRLPVPRPNNSDLYKQLGAMANNILLEETKFLEEIERVVRRDADSDYIDKLRRRHNAAANAMCLSVDKEIAKFLKLTDDDQELIAETLRDIKLTDFGYLEEAAVEESKSKTAQTGN